MMQAKVTEQNRGRRILPPKIGVVVRVLARTSAPETTRLQRIGACKHGTLSRTQRNWVRRVRAYTAAKRQIRRAGKPRGRDWKNRSCSDPLAVATNAFPHLASHLLHRSP